MQQESTVERRVPRAPESLEEPEEMTRMQRKLLAYAAAIANRIAHGEGHKELSDKIREDLRIQIVEAIRRRPSVDRAGIACEIAGFLRAEWEAEVMQQCARCRLDHEERRGIFTTAFDRMAFLAIAKAMEQQPEPTMQPASIPTAEARAQMVEFTKNADI